MKPPRAKKAARSSLKLRVAVDATRLALASVERIRSVLERKGKRLGPPVSDPEIDDRERMLRHKLPPSYLLTLHVTGDVGPPEKLLDAEGMTQAKKRVEAPGLVPFCEAEEGRILCFDRKGAADNGELPVVVVQGASVRPRARSFGEWLDSVADAREDAIASAANIPAQLKTMLLQLGFTFDELELTYNAGWATVPETVKHACAQIVRNAGATPALNVKMSKIDNLRVDYFRDSLIDASVREMLAPFVAQKVG